MTTRHRAPEAPKIVASTEYVGWTTAEEVTDFLGLQVMDDEDRRFLALSVAAANRALAFWRPELTPPIIVTSSGQFSRQFSAEFQGGASLVTPEDHLLVLGVTQLAAEFFKRRGADIAAFAELGGPPPVIGRDIEVMLRVGRGHGPTVA